jgi:hypothetical protein
MQMLSNGEVKKDGMKNDQDPKKEVPVDPIVKK